MGASRIPWNAKLENTCFDRNPHHSVHSEIREQLFENLRAKLPFYIVPKSISFLDHFPVNQNGKIDRHVLEKRVEQAPLTERGSIRQPTTEAERQMQRIWAEVLSIDPHDIALDDSFFKIGGDSLAAMKLFGLARKAKMQLSVADIFHQP